MKSITVVLLLACFLSLSYGKVAFTPSKGAIQLHKFGRAVAQSREYGQAYIKQNPFEKVVRTRGGSISDTFNNVIQNTNSLTAFKDSAAVFLQQYLVAPWVSTPPMTQLFVGLSFLITTLAAFLNSNEWPEELHFDIEKTLQDFQLWRPFTSFLHLGPFGFNYLLTLQFVWMYMSQLEKLMAGTPAEYLVMSVFGAASLLASYIALDLPTNFLGHNLAAYFVYIRSRIFEGNDINLMDLFTLKAEYLPWFFAAQTLLLEGEIPLMDMLGIGVGYVYQILKDKTGLVAAAVAWLTQNVFSLEVMRQLFPGQ